jgi:hypothetical protein
MIGTESDRALPPVVRTLSLSCGRHRAFDAFARQIHEWWPPGFTASGDDLARVVIEDRAGGRVYEVNSAGGEYDWGTVLDWEPDLRVTLSWTLALRQGGPTEVDVTFDGTAETCAVRLEHRGWHGGQDGDRSRFDDDGGWSVVLAEYQRYAQG